MTMNIVPSTILRACALASSLLLAAQSAAHAQFDDTWTLQANGQVATANPDGSFRIQNVPSADAFGAGGQGTPPDFIGDEFVRVTGTSIAGGITRYAYSEPFKVVSGMTFVLDALTITTTPPPLPAKIGAAISKRVLTTPGETAQVAVHAVLADGSLLDVTPATAWTSYKTSNPFVAAIDQDGVVTATGSGIAYLTANNGAATTVIKVTVSLGDPLTTVEGRVVDSDKKPVAGASVAVGGLLPVVSAPDGRFQVAGVPTLVGSIVAFASHPTLGSGSSPAVKPFPKGITDVGDVDLLPTSEGTEFMLAFQPNYQAGDTKRLFLAGEFSTTGTIAIPGQGFAVPFTVNVGQVTSVTLPSAAQANGTNQTTEAGVLVTAAAPIAVYGLSQIAFSTDGFTALPTNVAGMRYRVATYGSSFSNGTSQFAVTGLTDGTNVTITPAADSTGHPAGTPFAVTVDRFGAFQLQSNGDLTGSLVVADQPVIVTAGHLCANVPLGVAYCDHLIEIMTPVSYWGTEYFSMALASRMFGDTFRVLADSDGTVVKISSAGGSETINLGAGQFAERILEGANAFSSNKPILVVQYSHGSQYDGNLGDPFMMLLTPATRFRTSFQVATPPTGFATHYLNVIMRQSDVAFIVLDGQPLIPTAIEPLGTSGYVGASVSVGPGCHEVNSPNPCGIYLYGFNADDSYGYAGGL
jgi:hypothetical protein